MAQADAKEDVLYVEDYCPVSESIEYCLVAVQSGECLSFRGGETKPTMKSQKFKDLIRWKFALLNDGSYAIIPASFPKRYLSGHEHGFNPSVISGVRDANKRKTLQWKIIKVTENRVALQSSQSECYLAGVPPMPKMRKRDAKRDIQDMPVSLQWLLQPLDYKLCAKVSKFNFTINSQKKMDEILSDNKIVSTQSSQRLEIWQSQLGSKMKINFSESMRNTFRWNISESVGIGVSVETNADLPLINIGGNKVSISDIYTSTSNKERTQNETKTYSMGYEFEAASVGKYQIGMILYMAKNIKFDFNANVDFVAKNESDNNDNDSVLASDDLQSLLFYYQCDTKITSIDKDGCHGTVNGTLEATYPVEMETYHKKLN